MELEIDLSPELFNEVYFPAFASKARYLNMKGGGGSGKSVAAAQKKVMRALQEPGHRFLLIRKVARTIRKSQFQLLKDLISDWNLGGLWSFREAEMEAVCTINGSMFISAGMDDPEKIKSISGVTGIWIEEATELSERDFNQLDLRLRGFTPGYKQIVLTYNPIDHTHWLRRRFDEGGHDQDVVEVLTTTYRHNKFIDPDYRRQLEDLARIDEVYYRIYALGEWATPANIIYPKWDTCQALPGSWDDLVYGLDFGFNNPTALIELRMKDQELYARELVYESKLTNADLIDLLKQLIADRSRPIYADSAEPARIEEIRRAGFNVAPAEKAVRPGIDVIKRFPLHIEASSANIVREIRAYKWRQDKDGNVLDEPVKFWDHAMDAMRYAAATHGVRYWTIPGPVVLPSLRLERATPRPGRISRNMSGYE